MVGANEHARQLQTGKGTGADHYNGMLDCFRKIVKNEGYVYQRDYSKYTAKDGLGAMKRTSSIIDTNTLVLVSPASTVVSPPQS